MTLTVTPQPWNEPPRVRIDVDSDDPATPFSALQILRDAKPVREQPFVGSATAVTYDYEAPFGSPVTYSVEGATVTSSAVYTTAWANLTGWSTVSGSPAVSGGRLVASSGTAVVERTVALPTAGRLDVSARPAPGVAVDGAVSMSLGNAITVQTAGGPNPKWRVRFGVGPLTTIRWTSGPMSVQWSSGGATFATGEDNIAFSTAWDASSDAVRVSVQSPGDFPAFTISSVVTPVPFAANATPAYLDVPDAWLIHPSKPALSIPIEMGETGTGVRFIEASSGEQKTSAAVATVHRAVGRARAVVITSGPRQADEWTLVIGAETIAAKNAVRAIVDDQTPLLIRSHPDMNMDLPDDWYSVGDFTVNRVETPIITEMTLMNLPLTPVDEPVVRQGALWSWGNVLTSYATWADVLADNDTWLDVLAGPS